MKEYLSYKFKDTRTFVDTYDELPLWSASFGLLLLKHLDLKPGFTIIDIGSGTGFPLIELAARSGNSCKLYGIDPWKNACKRAKQKIKNYGITNVEIIEGSAEQIPFENNSVDLIVSNLGINNFEHPGVVMKECNRVLKPYGKVALTTNLNGHWKEFYNIFEATLKDLGKEKLPGRLKLQQAHRGSVESIEKLFTASGFTMLRHYEESFEMKFLDGTAFLNHYFIKFGWLESWKNLLSQKEIKEVFSSLEQNLNEYSNKYGNVGLTVPMAFIEGQKM